MRIRQVDNALDLIELFSRQKTPLTLTRMSRALDIPKSSAFNLIDTFLARGLLYEIHPRGGYYPTRRLFDLAREIMEGDSVLPLIHGDLVSLAASTGETVLLSARDPQNPEIIIYVDAVESAEPLRYNAKVGDKRPIHTTSSGKAILMTYTQDERRRILAAMPSFPLQENKTSNLDELCARLEEGTTRGWSEDRAEFMPDVMGLAVPIHFGERRFGLALAGPIHRMKERHGHLIELLRSTAARIHAILARD